MNIQEFYKFVEDQVARCTDVLCKKSADYSSGEDKLANFKTAALIDGISPIEALRGMHLKHRASIKQGLDDLLTGKVRPYEWWVEKMTDDLNYSLLLQALIWETYFSE